MSPRELFREMEAARKRIEDEIDRGINASWHVARFASLAFAGKLPPLPEVLNVKPEAIPVPVEPLTKKQQMATTVQMLAAYYGQPVRVLN